MHIDLVAPGLEAVIGKNPPLDRIAYGLLFGEGPVWDRRTEQLFYVDILSNTIWKWKRGVGKEIVLHPSGYADGMTFDIEGRLVVAGWSARTVWRLEHDGSIRTLVSHYQGQKLNTPNDIVVKSDGSIYWTDMAGGLMIAGMVAPDLQQYRDALGVFRLSPNGEQVDFVVDTNCVAPNGLAFTPDEKILYLNDSRLGTIRAFDVQPDGSLTGERLFHKLSGDEEGVADGMKVDSVGNVYCTGPGGIHVIDSGGNLLGRMRIPGHCTNMGWGDSDWRSLYITTCDSVWRTRVNIPGVATW